MWYKIGTKKKIRNRRDATEKSIDGSLSAVKDFLIIFPRFLIFKFFPLSSDSFSFFSFLPCHFFFYYSAHIFLSQKRKKSSLPSSDCRDCRAVERIEFLFFLILPIFEEDKKKTKKKKSCPASVCIYICIDSTLYEHLAERQDRLALLLLAPGGSENLVSQILAVHAKNRTGLFSFFLLSRVLPLFHSAKRRHPSGNRRARCD